MERRHRRLSFWNICSLILCCIGHVCGEREVVHTDILRRAKLGEEVTLPCRFNWESPTVLWRNGYASTNAPVLIKRQEDGRKSGSCLSDMTCDMDDDYSLIIKAVQIADQGQYFCLVMNNQGKYIQNTTDLIIYVVPREPYPTIDECEKLPCKISTSDPVTLTCSADRYHPDIYLSFLHGDENITSVETVMQNEDGTKNKSISFRASASEKVYTCVASGTPSSLINRRVQEVQVSDPYYPTPSAEIHKTTNALKVALPFFFVLAIILVFAGFLWKKYRRNTVRRDEENVPLMSKNEQTGKISFFKLWTLLDEASDMLKIRNMLTEVGLKDLEEDLDRQQAYQYLCEWKNEKRTNDQANLLKDAFRTADLKEAWDRAEERVRTPARLTDFVLEKILRDIGDGNKIQDFLQELIQGSKKTMDLTRPLEDIIQEALVLMKHWNYGPLDENLNNLISLALEEVKCSPLDRTFFIEQYRWNAKKNYFFRNVCTKLNKTDIKHLCSLLNLKLALSQNLALVSPDCNLETRVHACTRRHHRHSLMRLTQ